MPPRSTGRRENNARDLSARSESTVCGGGAARGEGGGGLVPVAAAAAVELMSWAAKVFADVLVPGACWPYCFCCLCDMKINLCVVCSRFWRSQNCSRCAGAH